MTSPARSCSAARRDQGCGRNCATQSLQGFLTDSGPIFEKVQGELEVGARHTLKYGDNAEVRKGDLFILDGQKVIVADMGDPFE